MAKVPRLMIAGTGSGSGKTTLTCALLRNFYNKGKRVVAFKCGPDYIDPMFHAEVLQTKSYNLDLFMLGEEVCKHLLCKHGQEADLSLIEGVMGFYDGISKTEEGSSYDLATRTQTPVVLVVSCKGMSVSLGALLQGYLNFKPNTIKGVILNGATAMTYSFYKDIVETYTSLKVFGYLPPLPECSLESRHLGLVTAKEVVALEEKLDKLGRETEKSIDFEGLMDLAKGCSELEEIKCLKLQKGIDISNDGSKNLPKIKIAIAKDKAFSFYYADNLELLEQLGVELVPFSPVRDEKLPEGISGLILGGGYPEVYTKVLSQNEEMKKSIRKALQEGMPCIAECGGFMYLQERIRLLNGEVYPMVGYLEGEAFMTSKLQRFGYIELTCKEDTMLCDKGEKVRAHEFHYSDSTVNGNSFVAKKPSKDKMWECIVAKDNLFAGYPHFHWWNNVAMAKKFVQRCENYKKGEDCKR